MGKIRNPSLWVFFLVAFGRRILSSQLDATALISLIMFKGQFEQIDFSLSR